jgi:hypothetical protein
MIDQDQAIDDAREAADATPADRLIERLAERLAELIGAKAGVRAVFGEPVQQGGVTVARAISEPGIPDRVRADRCDGHSSACSAHSALTTARASSR